MYCILYLIHCHQLECIESHHPPNGHHFLIEVACRKDIYVYPRICKYTFSKSSLQSPRGRASSSNYKHHAVILLFKGNRKSASVQGSRVPINCEAMNGNLSSGFRIQSINQRKRNPMRSFTVTFPHSCYSVIFFAQVFGICKKS